MADRYPLIVDSTSENIKELPSGDAILFLDNEKIKVGTGSDLTVYHDASNSYITNAVGALKVATETSGIAVTIGHTTSETTIADNLTVTGTLTGTLATAAQGSVTSLGTLTALTVDNLGINGNTITANSGAVNITPAAGSAIVLDGTINVDAGVVTGATSVTSTAFVGAVTGNADTATLATTATNVTASANNRTNETVYPTFVDGATSGQGIETDTGLFYNPSTGLFTTAGLDISGDIDVDGTTNLDNTDIDGSLTVDGAVDINATTFDIDASDDIDIDTTDTTGGIAIGTATSGVPITLGHGTSETTVGDNLTVTGNLTVSGTTTTVNSTVVTIADPVFEMGASGSDDNLDRGIKMKYNSSGAKLAFMGYDDSDGKFAFIPDATDSSSVFSGTQGTLKANIEASATGIKVGDSVPFSDSSGTLTLTNIDAIDATTETTLEAAIDSLSNLTTVGTVTSGTWQGTTIAVAQGGTALTAASTSGFVMTSNGSGFVMQSIDGGTYS